MCQFDRTIGIDYSGAKAADDRLPGLRVYEAKAISPQADDQCLDKVDLQIHKSGAGNLATERRPTSDHQIHWTRRSLAEWLKAELHESGPTIVGIDHAFSFPQPYFEKHDLPYCWHCFLNDFCEHWPTDSAGVSPRQMLKSGDPKVEARRGSNKMFRRTDMNSAAKSVFQFGVQGEVASSTHAGLPFLLQLRRSLPEVHFWPFDGWEIPPRTSCIVEAYPRLYVDNYEVDSSFTKDQRDAYVTAMWMHDADRDGRLKEALNPTLPDRVRAAAKYEGWILAATWWDTWRATSKIQNGNSSM